MSDTSVPMCEVHICVLPIKHVDTHPPTPHLAVCVDMFRVHALPGI